MTKLEIIQKVLVDTYGANPSLRSIWNDSCKYSSPDGRHCAVGMCMTPEALSTVREGDAITRVCLTKSVDTILQEEYRGHDITFWQALQRFHDNCNYFTKTGLSADGESRLKDLQYLYK